MDPEFLQRSNGGEVSINVGRLHNVGRNLRIISAGDIHFPAAAANDHHRDSPQDWISLHRFEDLTPIHFRQAQIEKDKVGVRRGNVTPDAIKKRQRLFSVGNHKDCRRHVGVAQRGERKLSVR